MTRLALVPALALALVAASCAPPGGETPDAPPPVTETAATAVGDSLIRLAAPQPDQLVTSPLRVTGEARGNWYFEASFPVHLLDASGREIAVVPATAQGEWMTTEFVPFSAELTFTVPAGESTGTLVLEKSNASGLPEHDDARRIPVRFAP
jgi:hypothetical protein